MNRIIVFLITVCLYKAGFAQNIDFNSKELEQAIKNRLDLPENMTLTQEFADKVTALDLSGCGLKDIQELLYFPNLEWLDLSYNGLEDISFLTGLKRLSFLDLSFNRLRSIDDLAFSESYEMILLIGGNYINDYILILNNPNCLFTIIGINDQKRLFRVNDFYADFDVKTSKKIINYNIWTYSEYDSVFLSVDGKMEWINRVDEHVQIKQNFIDDVVYLYFDNQTIDTAYFILPKRLEIMEIDTEITPNLPANLSILSSEAFQSNVTFTDESVVYTISENMISDTLKVGFGKNNYDIRSYTYYFLMNGNLTGAVPVIERNRLRYYPNPVDHTLTVHIPDSGTEKATVLLVSLTGQIVYQTETNAAIHQINMHNLAGGTFILLVQTAKETFTEKIIKK